MERGSRNAEDSHLHGMIHAYFDDSCDPNMKEYAACGGILGDSFNMTLTETTWNQATSHLKEPFRSTDCECQQGQFKDWSKEACNDLMDRLVTILMTEPIRCGILGVAVPIQLFHQIFPDMGRDAPYRFAVWHTVVSMIKVSRKHHQRCQLWFESGPRNGFALEAYSAAEACKFPAVADNNRLAKLAFGTKTMAPLQAADLAARESLKAALNHGKRPIRIPLRRLWGQAGIIVLAEKCLRQVKDAGGPFNMNALGTVGLDCYIREVLDNAYTKGRLEL